MTAGWYYMRGDEQVGPVDDATLKTLASSGRIRLDSLVFHADNTRNQWVKAEQIPAIQRILTLEPPRITSRPVIADRPSEPVIIAPPPLPLPTAEVPAFNMTHPPQPVSVFIQSPHSNYRQLSAGGWFSRSFSSTMGIVVALLVFVVGVPLVICAGCFTMALNTKSPPLATPVWQKPSQKSLSPKTTASAPIAKPSVGHSLLPLLKITAARFYYSENSFSSTPTIDITIQNNTGVAISRTYFKGRLISPGRTIPWVEENFNYSIPGGIEPGESTTLELSPNQFGKWGNAPKDRTDMVLEVAVVGLDDANGKSLK